MATARWVRSRSACHSSSPAPPSWPEPPKKAAAGSVALALPAERHRNARMRRADVLATTGVRAPIAVGELRRQLLEHIRIPLHRDGYALALNSAFTAATGLLYWILAAPTYSAHALRRNFSLLSR